MSDPAGNKFLELAVSDEANVVITSEKALLRLHTFHELPTLKPVGYLSRFSQVGSGHSRST